MVIPKEEKLVHSVRFSSVGPGRVTGTDVVHTPTPMDLAMKLHYLRGVYYFSSQATQGMTIKQIKESMFTWLNHYYVTCGRFRRSPDNGWPYMKCNDCGVRFIEAKSDHTIHEWLEMARLDCDLRNLLVSDHVIGPELSFSPPLFIQVTQFKCGGFSMSLNWAHILGDAFSAIDFINKWAQVIAGLKIAIPEQSKWARNSETIPKSPKKPCADPVPLKRVGPVGDHWVYSPKAKPGMFTFHLTSSQLGHLRLKFFGRKKLPVFESLCTVLWQCVARVKGEDEPRVATICKNDQTKRVVGPALTNNCQKVSSVTADFSVRGSDPYEVLGLLLDRAVEENAHIEEAVKIENGDSDFIIYGVNLTFVDVADADLYGLELNGLKPIYADYAIDGVGEEGLVLVLPAPESPEFFGISDDVGGRVLTVILPENVLSGLKGELKKNDMLVDEDVFG